MGLDLFLNADQTEVPFRRNKKKGIHGVEVIALSATKGSKYSSLNAFYESDELGRSF